MNIVITGRTKLALLTPDHFSGILHDLMDTGLIGVVGGNVTNFDAGRLRTYNG